VGFFKEVLIMQSNNYIIMYSTRTWHAINDTYKIVALNGKEKGVKCYVTAVKHHMSTN
jgi:hypothetical protein